MNPRRQASTSKLSGYRKHSNAVIWYLQMRWLMDLIIKSLFWSQIAAVQPVTAPWSLPLPLEGSLGKGIHCRAECKARRIADTQKIYWTHQILLGCVARHLLHSVIVACVPLHLKSNPECKWDILTVLFENTVPLSIMGWCCQGFFLEDPAKAWLYDVVCVCVCVCMCAHVHVGRLSYVHMKVYFWVKIASIKRPF